MHISQGWQHEQFRGTFLQLILSKLVM